ncbi:hypothetical protein VTN00DRAFT_5155 [Thermoascus crustaceus]|uniref:uncharacterized protein n=1 Tax=Thermoascus crustaceus TaxID=5088 RepID=UPI0037420EB4
MAPQNRVLSTPELLELILLHLDMRTLLTSAQLVCHAWTDLITSSPSIQQALFFRCVPVDSSSRTSIKKVYNPLLAELFPPFFPQDPTTTATAISTHQGHGNEDPVQNETNNNTSLTPDGQDAREFTLASLDLAKHPEKRTAYLRREASWRRMLIQQPPALTVSYVSVSSSRMGESWVRFTIPVPGGTTAATTGTVAGSNSDSNDKNNGNDDSTNDGTTNIGLRMNMLYDLLLLLGPWKRISSSLVLWWGQIPTGIVEEPELRQVFERAAAESDISIYTTWVVQCVVGASWSSPEEKFGQCLRFPYEDWGSAHEFFGIEPDEEGPWPGPGRSNRSRSSREALAETFGPEISRDQAILISMGRH